VCNEVIKGKMLDKLKDCVLDEICTWNYVGVWSMTYFEYIDCYYHIVFKLDFICMYMYEVNDMDD
jgi:hypothetical protein